jgi:hypothetical protein
MLSGRFGLRTVPTRKRLRPRKSSGANTPKYLTTGFRKNRINCDHAKYEKYDAAYPDRLVRTRQHRISNIKNSIKAPDSRFINLAFPMKRHGDSIPYQAI